jgi:hypothetical protein
LITACEKADIAYPNLFEIKGFIVVVVYERADMFYIIFIYFCACALTYLGQGMLSCLCKPESWDSHKNTQINSSVSFELAATSNLNCDAPSSNLNYIYQYMYN